MIAKFPKSAAPGQRIYYGWVLHAMKVADQIAKEGYESGPGSAEPGPTA
jgi:hypothetical protein